MSSPEGLLPACGCAGVGGEGKTSSRPPKLPRVGSPPRAFPTVHAPACPGGGGVPTSVEQGCTAGSTSVLFLRAFMMPPRWQHRGAGSRREGMGRASEAPGAREKGCVGSRGEGLRCARRWALAVAAGTRPVTSHLCDTGAPVPAAQQEMGTTP